MPKFLPCLLVLSLFVLAGVDTARGQALVNSVDNLTPLLPPPSPPPPPPVRREFRGVWVASVANIDWPSIPGLSSREQQDELVAILDRTAALRLNAVILQIRPGGDALYASPYEPWSEYLTGRMGQAPDPWYDPLEFAVREAHKRGLELHAWFNPYRARHPSAKSTPSPDHISRTRPELVKRYGRHLWMDPGEPAIRQHTIQVVLDVVKRYDIDGVHIDDYFYPYKEKNARGSTIDFPDAGSYRRYRNNGGRLGKDDWRRENVDSLIRQVYVRIKATKPWVKFGISPFGVWRPGNPPEIGGLDSFSELYGDSRKWVLNGWGDYFTPQLYWPITREDLAYPVLLQWWVEQNARARHVWPGNYVDKVTGTPTGWPSQEMLDQIALTRAQPGATGNVYFSVRSLMYGRDGLPEKMVAGPYANRALVPASPWLDSVAPSPPIVRAGRDSVTGASTLSLQPQGAEATRLWVIRTRAGNDWSTEIVSGLTRFYMIPRHAEGIDPDAVSVSAVDRTGNESTPVVVGLIPSP